MSYVHTGRNISVISPIFSVPLFYGAHTVFWQTYLASISSVVCVCVCIQIFDYGLSIDRLKNVFCGQVASVVYGQREWGVKSASNCVSERKSRLR